MNQRYETQRERLLNLKKGIAFQKAFMASVERLKDKGNRETHSRIN